MKLAATLSTVLVGLAMASPLPDHQIYPRAGLPSAEIQQPHGNRIIGQPLRVRQLGTRPNSNRPPNHPNGGTVHAPDEHVAGPSGTQNSGSRRGSTTSQETIPEYTAEQERADARANRAPPKYPFSIEKGSPHPSDGATDQPPTYEEPLGPPQGGSLPSYKDGSKAAKKPYDPISHKPVEQLDLNRGRPREVAGSATEGSYTSTGERSGTTNRGGGAAGAAGATGGVGAGGVASAGGGLLGAGVAVVGGVASAGASGLAGSSSNDRRTGSEKQAAKKPKGASNGDQTTGTNRPDGEESAAGKKHDKSAVQNKDEPGVEPPCNQAGLTNVSACLEKTNQCRKEGNSDIDKLKACVIRKK